MPPGYRPTPASGGGFKNIFDLIRRGQAQTENKKTPARDSHVAPRVVKAPGLPANLRGAGRAVGAGTGAFSPIKTLPGNTVNPALVMPMGVPGSSNGGSSSSSSSTTISGEIPADPTVATPTAPAAPYVPDFKAMYDAAANAAKGYGDSALGEFDKTKSSVSSQYAKAAADLAAMIKDSQSEATASAAGLGVDASASTGQTNEALARIKANAGSAEAADLAFFDKMKALRADDYAGRYSGIRTAGATAESDYMEALRAAAAEAQAKEDERQAELADFMFKEDYKQSLKGGSAGGGGGSGGGGRGGSGGGSSSSKTKQAAQLDEYLYNPHDLEQIKWLQQQDPTGQAAAIYARWNEMGEGEGLVKTGRAELDLLNNTNTNIHAPSSSQFKTPGIAKSTQQMSQAVSKALAKIKADKLKKTQLAFKATKVGSGIEGNPDTRKWLKTTGK